MPVGYPERIDWFGGYIARNGEYVVGIATGTQVELTRENFGDTIRTLYGSGLRALTGNAAYTSALPDDYPLGELIVEFADLVQGLERVSFESDPTDSISYLIIRTPP